MTDVYVSITGLELRRKRYLLRFWWHAIRSMEQAKRADGNISVDARTINGVHHTRTVWKNEAAMRSYLVAGPHLQAMKAFSDIATGKTLGFYADTIPDWIEVHKQWAVNGKPVGRVIAAISGDITTP